MIRLIAVTFSWAGVLAVTFCFGKSAALYFGVLHFDRSAKTERQLNADFLGNGEFAGSSGFALTVISYSNDGRAAAYG